MLTLVSPPEPLTLNSQEMMRRVNALRETDHATNWFYRFGGSAFPAATLGSTIAFDRCRAGGGLPWWWNVPLTLLSSVLVGAGQHRVTPLAHEASHYLLFRNRL